MSLTLDQFTDAGIIAVLRGPSEAATMDGIRALVAGGVTGIEVTYSTPNAADVIARAATEFGDRILLGAGTLRTDNQVREAAGSGAQFLVSPGFDARLAEAMQQTGLITMMGALTPTEVMAADSAGADVVKIFPAALHGPALIKNLRGPFPDVPFMPTGGVTVGNVPDWVAAGVVALGAGSALVSGRELANGSFEAVRDHAEQFTDAYRCAREEIR